MRDKTLTFLRFALVAAPLWLTGSSTATAQADEAARVKAWENCIATNNSGAERLAACTTAIASGTLTGPRLAGALCIRGHELTEKNELDAALMDLDAAIAADSTYACAFNNRARVHEHKGDYDRAIADFSEAIRLDPNFAIAYRNRAMMHAEKGDHARAIEDYSAVIRIAPNLNTYLARGDAYRTTEQLDRAAADYGEVIRMAPTDARGWRNRGLIRLFQGNNKAGIADYDRALQYDAADAYSWNNRGQAKLRVGDRKGAIADFRKALQVSPGLQTAVASLQKLGVKP